MLQTVKTTKRARGTSSDLGVSSREVLNAGVRRGLSGAGKRPSPTVPLQKTFMFIVKGLQLPDDFASAFESAFARLQIRVETACAGETDWPAQVAAALRAALAFAASDIDSANALTSEVLANGSAGYARYDRMLNHFGEQLLPGRALRPEGEWLPEITEKAMVGGIVTLVAQRLDMGRAAELPGLAAEAIQFVLTPYLGTEEARRIVQVDE